MARGEMGALFVAGDAPPHSAQKNTHRTARAVAQEEAAMHRHFDDLRTLGRQLEESGVLNGALKARGNSWGLHMPLVCPDGAVVPYAWKRQLAGQAGASAVDRTRIPMECWGTEIRTRWTLAAGAWSPAPHKTWSSTLIKDTDKKGLATIADEVKQLTQRARDNSLKPKDYEGGAFTVSNLGGPLGLSSSVPS